MKRILLTLALALISLAACAETAVQQDQNYGFLTPATATFGIPAGTYLELTTSAKNATWTSTNSTGSFCIIPARTKGFAIRAFNADFLLTDLPTCATSPLYTGFKIASGTTLKWESNNPDMNRVRYWVVPAGATGATVTFSFWGN
jgi:hypothetical protein